MSKPWRTIRVFISSTFTDMHAERDRMVKYVFPEIRERLEKHRLHFVDIDLRWGITSEQAENDLVLDLCLDQIDQARPFFIGILGQRYGWIPTEITAPLVKKYGWIQGMTGKSITELEIVHGVLRDPEMHGRSLFLFRRDDFLKAVRDDVRNRFFLGEHPDKLSRLKEEIQLHCERYGIPLIEYSCFWNAKLWNSAGVTHGMIDGLTDFGESLKKCLLTSLAAEYPEILAEPPARSGTWSGEWFQEEQNEQERFVESRTMIFVGRNRIQEQIYDLLRAPSPMPILISGEAGLGKSAILAQLSRDLPARNPGAIVLSHFVGASPLSRYPASMLRRLCLLLGRSLDT
ncbi:DUF4062 domain-containing protein, partial [candidate division CSSED10-310 bacterium]